MTKQLKIYGDTNTLSGNASNASERSALRKLAADGVAVMSSNLVNYEAMKTANETKRNALVADHNTREKVAKNERIWGHQSYGDGLNWVTYPLLSDVQDEQLQAEIIAQGIELYDAKHLSQAFSNDCDIFLTTDNGVIEHRAWLEQRLKLKIRLPSELLKDIEGGTYPQLRRVCGSRSEN